jgi:hypothetical protein
LYQPFSKKSSCDYQEAYNKSFHDLIIFVSGLFDALNIPWFNRHQIFLSIPEEKDDVTI